jgi:sugar/nucleoside kinase (ribokinase family)
MNFLGVFGHANVDHIFCLPKLPKSNQTVKVLKRQMYFGGTGANIARIAARLGVKTALSSFVGEDFPDDYYTTLKKEGIDLTDFKKVDGYTTSTCWILTSDGREQVTLIDQGPMQAAGKFGVAEHTVRNSEIVHVGTGSPDYYAKVVNLAARLNKRISFDPAQELRYIYTPQKFEALLGKTDYFFANEDEVDVALRYLRLKEPKDLLELADNVVVTRGKKGSIILTESEELKIPAIKAKKVTGITGAGDGYRAGFYAALRRRWDMEKCGLAGAATASYVIEGNGPQENIPTWEKVLDRMETCKI